MRTRRVHRRSPRPRASEQTATHEHRPQPPRHQVAPHSLDVVHTLDGELPDADGAATVVAYLALELAHHVAPQKAEVEPDQAFVEALHPSGRGRGNEPGAIDDRLPDLSRQVKSLVDKEPSSLKDQHPVLVLVPSRLHRRHAMSVEPRPELIAQKLGQRQTPPAALLEEIARADEHTLSPEAASRHEIFRKRGDRGLQIGMSRLRRRGAGGRGPAQHRHQHPRCEDDGPHRAPKSSCIRAFRLCMSRSSRRPAQEYQFPFPGHPFLTSTPRETSVGGGAWMEHLATC